MGSAMARRLIDAGHDVTVWNRSPQASEPFADSGARVATDPTEAIAKPVIISMLANDQAADAVFSVENLASAPEGAVHVNMASVSLECGTMLRERHAEAGVGYVASPVLGRPPVAAAGQLTIVAGGPAELVERVMPLYEVLGKKVWNVGEDPAGANLVKIGVNFNIIHALQAMGESITLVEKGGIDPVQFVDILNASLFPGPVYDGYGHMIAERRYAPPGFNVTLGRKDLRLAQEAAGQLGVELPTASGLAEVFDAALDDEQIKDLDWAVVAEVTRRRSGASPMPAQPEA